MSKTPRERDQRPEPQTVDLDRLADALMQRGPLRRALSKLARRLRHPAKSEPEP